MKLLAWSLIFFQTKSIIRGIKDKRPFLHLPKDVIQGNWQHDNRPVWPGKTLNSVVCWCWWISITLQFARYNKNICSNCYFKVFAKKYLPRWGNNWNIWGNIPQILACSASALPPSWLFLSFTKPWSLQILASICLNSSHFKLAETFPELTPVISIVVF